MLIKPQLLYSSLVCAFLLILTPACKKQSQITLPIEKVAIDTIAPVVKITFPKRDSTYLSKDTLNIHVEVEDNLETNYPNIIISRLYDNNSTIEASYGASFPAKHFSAEMGWLVVPPLTEKDTIMIMATSQDNAGNLGKDSVIFFITQ